VFEGVPADVHDKLTRLGGAHGPRGEMRGLVRAEFRKTFATSAWWWLAVLGMVIAALQELTAVREEYVAFSMSRSLDWALPVGLAVRHLPGHHRIPTEHDRR